MKAAHPKSRDADNSPVEAPARLSPAPDLAPGLYVVATPIGNLGDLTLRARNTLAQVGAIAVEDSRITARLLAHIGIRKPMIPYHDHSDAPMRDRLLARAAREAIALVSDAGTPLISDPGFKLIRAARAAGVPVFTLPGPSALTAALTLAGLPTDRVLFLGFLPAKAMARARAIEDIASVRATLVLYESGPRLAATLAQLAATLGARAAAVVREISKIHEETVDGPLDFLAEHYAENGPPRGEIVIVVGPAEEDPPPDRDEVETALRAALVDQPPARAARDIARRFKADRAALYALALAWKSGDEP